MLQSIIGHWSHLLNGRAYPSRVEGMAYHINMEDERDAMNQERTQ